MRTQTGDASHAIGVDIGGTTSRAALVDQNNAIIESARCPTPDQLERLITWIADNYRAWTTSNKDATSIGLALPGVVDPVTGTLIRSVNLPWLEGEPIVDQLGAAIGHRPALVTDADAATWGEYLDLGSPTTPFAHLRLGTGVACGVVVDSKLIPTDPARRTHWSLLVVDKSEDAPICPCGLRGCLEIFAGGDSLGRKARDLGFLDLSDVSRGVGSNYTEAIALVDRAAGAILMAVANLARKYGVDTVIMAGGVVRAIPQLLFRITEVVSESLGGAVRINSSSLRDDAGVLGAARLAARMITLP